MIDTPQLSQTRDQLVAALHLTIPRDQIQSVMGPGIAEVMAALDAQGITPAGPWFTHHLKMAPDVFDFEICVPVATPVTAVGRVTPGVLPAAKVAWTTYRGPYDGLGAAWGEFMAWIEKERLESRDDLWEIYAAGPESSPDPADWRTELYRPLVG